AEAVEAGGLVEESLVALGLALDHFLQQVVVNQPVRGNRARLRAGRLLAGQQPQAQAGDPALAALQQQGALLVAQSAPLPLDQGTGLVGIQPQVLHLQLQQLAVQAQPGQVPGGPLAAGDQQAHAGRQVVEDELQAAVQHRTLRQVIVVQYQQQVLPIEAGLQGIEQVAQPGLEGKGLVRLAHAQQGQAILVQVGKMATQTLQQAFEEAPGIAVTGAQVQPEGAPVVAELLAEFTGQRALAEAG